MPEESNFLQPAVWSYGVALLGFLARGHSLPRACALATDLTHEAIRAAARLGRGRSVIPGFRSPA